MMLPMASWFAASRWCSRRSIASGESPCVSSARCSALPGRRRRSTADRAATAAARRRTPAAARSMLARGVAQHAVDRSGRRPAPASAMRRPQPPRLFAVPARRQHVLGEAPQLVDQRDAQHDRDRPQLADVERDAALVGADVADQRLQVEAAGRVRDQIARRARRRAGSRRTRRRPASAARSSTCAADPAGRRAPDPGRRDGCRGASLRTESAARFASRRTGSRRPRRAAARPRRAAESAGGRAPGRARAGESRRAPPRAIRAAPG